MKERLGCAWVFAGRTVIVPIVQTGCISQSYLYVPGVVSVTLITLPGRMVNAKVWPPVGHAIDSMSKPKLYFRSVLTKYIVLLTPTWTTRSLGSKVILS